MEGIPRVHRELAIYNVIETATFLIELTHKTAFCSLQDLSLLLLNKQINRLLLLCIEITIAIMRNYRLLSAY